MHRFSPAPYGVLLLLAALSPAAAVAHHAGPARDTVRNLTLSGTVQELRWSNPRVWLHVAVPGSAGAIERWHFVGASVMDMAVDGWYRGVLRAGETVTVTYRPALMTSRSGGIVAVTRADGRTLLSSR